MTGSRVAGSTDVTFILWPQLLQYLFSASNFLPHCVQNMSIFPLSVYASQPFEANYSLPIRYHRQRRAVAVPTVQAF